MCLHLTSDTELLPENLIGCRNLVLRNLQLQNSKCSSRHKRNSSPRRESQHLSSLLASEGKGFENIQRTQWLREGAHFDSVVTIGSWCCICCEFNLNDLLECSQPNLAMTGNLCAQHPGSCIPSSSKRLHKTLLQYHS